MLWFVITSTERYVMSYDRRRCLTTKEFIIIIINSLLILYAYLNLSERTPMLITIPVQARNQGGSGGSSEPPFCELPFQKYEPPPHTSQLHIWHRIPSMSITAVSTLTQHTWPTSWGPLLIALRTPPFNISSEQPTWSNRLNIPKDLKQIATGESSGTPAQFCCS